MKGGDMRNLKLCGCLALAMAGLMLQAAPEDSVKQDFKTAGKDVGHGARKFGHGVKRGGKEVGHDVKHGGKEVGHGFKDGAKDVGHGFKRAVKPD
jgi:hypothetical protein